VTHQIAASLTRQTPSLLVVEDSDEDFEALRRFLRLSRLTIPVQRCVNADDALNFLSPVFSNREQARSPRPSLIILDLNLPGTDGRELLHRIKQDDTLRLIPVVVFTTSNNPKDIEACYRYGVNSYIVKPINFDQLKRTIQVLLDYWFELVSLPNGVAI